MGALYYRWNTIITLQWSTVLACKVGHRYKILNSIELKSVLSASCFWLVIYSRNVIPNERLGEYRKGICWLLSKLMLSFSWSDVDITPVKANRNSRTKKVWIHQVFLDFKGTGGNCTHRFKISIWRIIDNLNQKKWSTGFNSSRFTIIDKGCVFKQSNS